MKAMAFTQMQWTTIAQQTKVDAIQSAHDNNYPAIASERIFGE
jgi:hypothetical protein